METTMKTPLTEEDLAAINTLARAELTQEQIYTFAVRLCDNEVDRDYLPVKTYDNDTMPSTGTKIPMILGDLKEGIAYWDRRQFTIKVSDVASVGELNAFEQDLTIWRGSLRDDCTSWDDEAWVNGYIDTAAGG